MNPLWRFMGRTVYVFGLPVLYLYLRNTHRSRVLIIANGQVLLVRTWIGNGKWTVPGGGLHDGEDPREGAVREVYEETGVTLQAHELEQIGEFPYGGSWFRFTCHGFVVRVTEAKIPRRQFPEIGEVAWIPLSEIDAQDIGADVSHLLKTWQTGQ